MEGAWGGGGSEVGLLALMEGGRSQYLDMASTRGGQRCNAAEVRRLALQGMGVPDKCMCLCCVCVCICVCVLKCKFVGHSTFATAMYLPK
jgi:hypothetical protein